MASERPSGSATVLATVRELLEDVRDPEIPVLTLADLGVLRDVAVEGDCVTVTLTPTYSGCPAMHTMEQDVRRVLAEAGYRDVVVKTRLAPAWTTDWLTPAAHAKLRSVGIAPPVNVTTDKRALLGQDVPCPRCASRRTEKVSEFGSTACKALYRCRDCLEPFDYFKCL